MFEFATYAVPMLQRTIAESTEFASDLRNMLSIYKWLTVIQPWSRASSNAAMIVSIGSSPQDILKSFAETPQASAHSSS